MIFLEHSAADDPQKADHAEDSKTTILQYTYHKYFRE
jgi:hypothetical protein